jgi:hypothetical protein
MRDPPSPGFGNIPPRQGGKMGTTYNKPMFARVFCTLWVQQQVQHQYNVTRPESEVLRRQSLACENRKRSFSTDRLRRGLAIWRLQMFARLGYNTELRRQAVHRRA